MLIALTLAAGCASPDERFPESIATPTSGPVADDFDRERALREGGGAAPAPELAVGRAWTYEGFEFYNEDATFTVVVAQADAQGYLFAAGAEDDLVYPALWGSRWFGERPRDLSDGDVRMLRFPLSDGASWEYFEGFTLTARAAQVDTPLGPDAGFVVEGADERRSIHIEYSPRAQNVVRYTATRADGSVRDDLRMARIADAQPWIWFELGPLTVVPNPHEPAVFDVAEGFDHVLVSAGGASGGRARVASPAGPAWDAEFAGEGEVWRHAMLDATPGRWAAAIAGRPFVEGAPELPVDAPVGWAYMHVAPVRWTRSL